MAMTSEQISDFRKDVNDTCDAPFWSDADIQRLYARAGDNYNGAVVFALDQLLMTKSDKWFNNTQGDVTENRDAVWKHVETMRKIWQARYEKDLRVASTKIVGMRISRTPKSNPYA